MRRLRHLASSSLGHIDRAFKGLFALHEDAEQLTELRKAWGLEMPQQAPQCHTPAVLEDTESYVARMLQWIEDG